MTRETETLRAAMPFAAELGIEVDTARPDEGTARL